MDRRTFIQESAVIGGVGLAGAMGTSCGRLFSERGGLALDGSGLPDMRTYLAQVVEGLALIEGWDHPSETDLSKKSLRTLYLTGMFADLPEEGQTHPGMQERMWQAMPDMDDAVLGMSDYLRARSPAELTELQRTLRERPDAPMEISDLITSHAGSAGVSGKRRLQTRAIIGQVSARLKRQPPSLLISEYDAKVRKLAAHSGSHEEIERHLAARLGNEAYAEKRRRLETLALLWAQQEGAAQGAVAATPSVATEADPEIEADGGVDGGTPEAAAATAATPIADPTPSPSPSPKTAPAPERTHRQRLMRGGGVTMGLSLVVAGVGGLICLAAPVAGWIILTVGGVQLLIGLVVLIVGAAHDKP